MIELLSSPDIPSISSLHKKELPGFLSKLGEHFLTEFYEMSLRIPTVFTFVYKKDGVVAGFATGVETTGNLLATFLKKNPMRMGGALCFAILTHPKLIFDVFKTLAYPGFKHGNPELLSIAVDRKYQREGIGGVLFKEVIIEFRKRKINSFKVSIYDGMSANSFYKKMGCTLDSSFFFMGKKMNYYKAICKRTSWSSR